MHSDLVAILTGLLTSGVIMLFVENQHIATNVYAKYESIMIPFMHKLTNYFKFAFSSNVALTVTDFNNKSIMNYKKRLDLFRKYAHMTIMDGRDYPINFFTAKELDELCGEINNVWYFGSRSIQSIEGAYTANEYSYDKDVRNNLKEVLQDEQLCQEPLSAKLINTVSSRFFNESYMPIKHIPQKYEIWEEKCQDFRELAVASVGMCVLSITLLLLWQTVPDCLMVVLTMISLLLFCGTLYYLIDVDKYSRKIFK